MDIDPEEWRQHRSYLMAVAYRLLGTVREAEDAVQEAYLRLHRHEGTEIVDVRRWLTTVVSRICLDELRSARVRRERYLGTWLPEPVIGADAQPGPGERVELRESVQTAMLIVLENLTPRVVPAARHEVRGATDVARLVHGLTEHYSGATFAVVPVNGGPGIRGAGRRRSRRRGDHRGRRRGGRTRRGREPGKTSPCAHSSHKLVRRA